MDEQGKRLVLPVGKAVVVVDLKTLGCGLFFGEDNLGGLEPHLVDEGVKQTATAGVEFHVLGDLIQTLQPELEALGVGVEQSSRILSGDFKPRIKVSLAEEVSADVNPHDLGRFG